LSLLWVSLYWVSLCCMFCTTCYHFECYFSACSYADYQYAECHYAGEYHYADCFSAKYRYAGEYHYADCYSAKCHQAECYMLSVMLCWLTSLCCVSLFWLLWRLGAEKNIFVFLSHFNSFHCLDNKNTSNFAFSKKILKLKVEMKEGHLWHLS